MIILICIALSVQKMLRADGGRKNKGIVKIRRGKLQQGDNSFEGIIRHYKCVVVPGRLGEIGGETRD